MDEQKRRFRIVLDTDNLTDAERDTLARVAITFLKSEFGDRHFSPYEVVMAFGSVDEDGNVERNDVYRLLWPCIRREVRARLHAAGDEDTWHYEFIPETKH